MNLAPIKFQGLEAREKQLAKDIWVSPLAPFGVIKMTDADGKGLVLLDHGTGAESSITETPQKVPGSS